MRRQQQWGDYEERMVREKNTQCTLQWGAPQITLSTLAPKVLTSLRKGTKGLSANASRNYVDAMQCCPQQLYQQGASWLHIPPMAYCELITTRARLGQPPHIPGHKHQEPKEDVIFPRGRQMAQPFWVNKWHRDIPVSLPCNAQTIAI